MEEKQFVAQGDVVLRRVESLPRNARLVHPDGATIALGEVTGHHHTVAGAQGFVVVDDPRAPTPTGVLEAGWVVVTEDTELTHQEHAPLDVPAGVYEVLYQRTLGPLGIPMRVQD